MKMFGKALFVLTSFFFLCVLLVIVSSKLFDVRPIISWASKTFAEHEILIHEKVSINYFPHFEFVAKNVVIKEADRIGSDGFIKVNHLELQINTKELITKQSVTIKISIDGFDVVSKLNDVNSTNLDRLLSTNFDIEGHIVGNLEIGASADSWSELNKNLNGTLELSIYNGLWRENDIFYMLRRARAIYKRDEDPEYTNKTIKQEFHIQASGNIIDSVYVNDDFKMKMPYSNIIGSGTINFSSMAIDYSIQAIFDDELKSALKMTNDEFLDFSEKPLPIRVRNQSGSLELRPDIENIFRNDVEDTLNKQEERLKESIRKNLTYQ
tara:strand:+ start:202 stop:1173 length:972 start_codon:yes stop_codon:yes gene_type:complete